MENPPLSPQLLESVRRIYCWYESMIDLKSGRFIYEYDAINHLSIMENCPIRDLGSVWDVTELLQFAKSHNIPLRTDLYPKQFHSFRLEDKIQEWIQYYVSLVVPFQSFRYKHANLAHINSAKLEEPASIAHSAFLLLCLVTDEASRKNYLEVAKALAEGIVSQQRSDGSFKIYFSDVRDSGIELYPGEAMLSLMRLYEIWKDPSILRCVEAAFPFYRDYYYDGNLSDSVTVFFFNWMAQSLKLLYCYTQDLSIKESIIKFLVDLQDALTNEGFYNNIKKNPRGVATVTVACGLEGLADLYFLLVKENMEEPKYKEDMIKMVEFLLKVQNKDMKSRGFGGFGHGIAHEKQRIDVTGHVSSAFIKVLETRAL